MSLALFLTFFNFKYIVYLYTCIYACMYTMYSMKQLYATVPVRKRAAQILRKNHMTSAPTSVAAPETGQLLRGS